MLAQFIRSSIILSASWSFNVTECSASLEKFFGFKIPDAVIRTCLKKRLKREGELSLSQGIYTTTEKFVKNDSLKVDYSTIQSEQAFIINKLIAYVERVTIKILDETERRQLSEDFYSYFLGGLQPCDNSLFISEFIVKDSSSVEFTEKLNRVEEGLILYSGICHSSNLANHEPWRNNFTILLDTEVLFYSQGFNGTLHKKIFDDFHALIKEINTRTAHDVKIELRYFEEAKREVEDFFYAAERIVEQRQEPDPSKPAMINITNGCRSAGDVLLKKAKFYDELRRLRIQEEISRNYYEPPTYVIDDAHTIKLLQEEYPEINQEKIPDVLRLFTKINYLRRGSSNQGLEQSSAILVSGKNITRALAFSKLVLQGPKQIPFATDMDYLTERLWFKLNKGFGEGKLPTSFDVVARAQVILSTQAGRKVAEDYKSLISQVNSGEMSIDSAGYLLSELRSRTTKPEDFRPDTVDEIAAFLRSEFIEDALRQKSLLQQKAEEAERSKKQLDILQDKIKQQADEAKEQSNRYQQQAHQTFNRHQTELRTRDIELHKERLKPLRTQAKLEFYFLVFIAYSLAAGAGLAVIFCLQSANDTPLGKLSVALGIIPLVIMLITGKFISARLTKLVRHRYKQRRRGKLTIRCLSSYLTE